MATLAALDVETKCGKPGCVDPKCEHALIPHYAKITVVGIWHPEWSHTFRDMLELRSWLASENHDLQFVGHNFKYDFEVLHFNGVMIHESQWAEDTSLMATASYEKIPEKWLKQYAEERKVRNADLPKGISHRVGGRHSLKCQAPYYLNVEPFWENPADHDSDEYVLKDCEYTYRLCEYYRKRLPEIGCEKVYREILLPAAKMFAEGEIRGVTLDMAKLPDAEKEAEEGRAKAEAALKNHWAIPLALYEEKQREEIAAKYDAMAEKFLASHPNAAPALIYARYDNLKLAALSKVEPFNMASPAQLMWLLRDYYGLPVKDFSGDDSTGKEVLEELAGQGREDIREFLSFRKWNQRLSLYFPTWRDLQKDGVIRPSFGLDVTRTGRTNCTKPNFQQVTAELKRLIIARANHKFITKDLAGIEPALMGYFSEDEKLCKLLIQGENFHGYCARIFFTYVDCVTSAVKKLFPKERDCTKTGDLSAFYGTGAKKLRSVFMKNGFLRTIGDVKQMLSRYKEHFSGVFDYKKGLDVYAKSSPIPALFGYKRSFIDCPDDIYMKAFNGQIQISASNLLLNAGVKARAEYKRRGLRAWLVLWVHDEMVVEAHEDDAEEAAKILDEAMTSYELNTKWGRIPLAVEGAISTFWEK